MLAYNNGNNARAFFFTTAHVASDEHDFVICNRVNLIVPDSTVGKRDMNGHHYREPHSRHNRDQNARNSAEL